MATRALNPSSNGLSANRLSLESMSGLRDTIREFEELPEFVRHANFNQVSERLLDSNLFNTIVSQIPNPAADGDWTDRLQRRHDALLPHIDGMLMCVFIRLPGVHYTIEVDEEAGQVVYWEWQAD